MAGIRFENELSSAFRVTRVLVVFDGAIQYSRTDDRDLLGDQHEIPIFDGSIPPGDHTVQLLVSLRGHGFGVFSYLDGYKFELRSTHSFTALPDTKTSLRAIAYERGGVTTPIEERPSIRWVESVTSATPPARPAVPKSP